MSVSLAPMTPEEFKAYPRSIDFNIYGGINSDVYLLITDNLRIAGTTITTPEISKVSAICRLSR